jgi:hypothetical protein
MICQLNRNHSSEGSSALKEVSQVGNQTALRDEGAIENMWGDHKDDHRGFLTILDNVITVSELAGGAKQAAGLSLT